MQVKVTIYLFIFIVDSVHIYLPSSEQIVWLISFSTDSQKIDTIYTEISMVKSFIGKIRKINDYVAF